MATVSNRGRARAPSLIRAAVLFAIPGSCGGGHDTTAPREYSSVPAPAGGVAEFSFAPVDLATSGTITPLGNLAPPGHVLPTDHAYIYAVDFDARPIQANREVRDVVAPATGAVTFILHQPGDDWKIEFRATATFFYYLDHVQLDPSIKVGDIIRAGQKIGVTNPGGSIDLGAFDQTVTLGGFLNPARYSPSTLHCVTPWKYFTEPLRSTIYARVRRVPGVERDARIDFGVAGRLAGDWFHESLPETVVSSGPEGWPKTISFAYDYRDPRLVRVSIGGTVAGPGVWAIPDDAPRPEVVSVSSGRVAYRLLYSEGRTQYGIMLVEMLTDTKLHVQVFEGSQVSATEFDSRAQVYLR